MASICENYISSQYSSLPVMLKNYGSHFYPANSPLNGEGNVSNFIRLRHRINPSAVCAYGYIKLIRWIRG